MKFVAAALFVVSVVLLLMVSSLAYAEQARTSFQVMVVVAEEVKEEKLVCRKEEDKTVCEVNY